MPPVEPPQNPDDTAPRLRVAPRDGGRVGAALALLAIAGVVGLLAVTLAGRYWHAPPGPFVVLVTFLPYLYVSALVVLFLSWSFAPDRAIFGWLLGGVFATALGLWGPSWPSRVEDADGESLVAMSWNVQRLWGEGGDVQDPLACVVETIEQADPDVITLLEVSREDVDALSDRLGLACVHTTYGGTSGARQGGLAACVRGDRWTLRRGVPQRFVDHEDWYYVFSEVERAGRVVNLLSVHFYPYGVSDDRIEEVLSGLLQGVPDDLVDLGRSSERVHRAQGAQSAALLARVARHRDPTLVAGDFNSTRDAALHADLRSHLVDTWERGGHGFGSTVDLGGIPLRVDYIYASDAFAVAGAGVPAARCSDHRPVVSHLVLRDAEPG